MRFDLNLASQPYEDARAFYWRWGTALALVILITMGLVSFAIHEWLGTRENSSKISQVRQQVTRLETERRDNEAILNRAENRSTRDRSQFVNGLIARKSFSWTQVFSDLEKIIPARVHVLSITPELNEDRQVAIRMRVAGDSRQKTVEELARRLEQSRTFKKAVVVREQINLQSPTGDTVQAEIEAQYVPQLRSRGE
jgi:ribosomal protein L29